MATVRRPAGRNQTSRTLVYLTCPLRLFNRPYLREEEEEEEEEEEKKEEKIEEKLVVVVDEEEEVVKEQEKTKEAGTSQCSHNTAIWLMYTCTTPLLYMAHRSKQESGDHSSCCTGSRHVCMCSICSERASLTTSRCWEQDATQRLSGENRTSLFVCWKLSEKSMMAAVLGSFARLLV